MAVNRDALVAPQRVRAGPTQELYLVAARAVAIWKQGGAPPATIHDSFATLLPSLRSARVEVEDVGLVDQVNAPAGHDL